MNRKGIKNVLFVAPNYVGGKDAATGFKRYYKGKLVDEMYTSSGSSTTRPSLSQIPRRQARGAVRVPSRRHGRQLHQAVRRGGPVRRTSS